MRKKSLFLLCAIMATITASAYDFTAENKGKTLNYNILTDETCEVAKGTYSGDIVIPQTVTFEGNTYKVTSVGQWAFMYCGGLTSVEIPTTVTTICNAAFLNCTALTSVEIPNSVTSIGESAFSNCRSLTSVDIPGSVTSIGDSGFWGCSSLTSVTVNNSNPANISLGVGVFYDVPTETCVLYVPKNSTELYAKADQWKNFKNVKSLGR